MVLFLQKSQKNSKVFKSSKNQKVFKTGKLENMMKEQYFEKKRFHLKRHLFQTGKAQKNSVRSWPSCFLSFHPLAIYRPPITDCCYNEHFHSSDFRHSWGEITANEKKTRALKTCRTF